MHMHLPKLTWKQKVLSMKIVTLVLKWSSNEKSLKISQVHEGTIKWVEVILIISSLNVQMQCYRFEASLIRHSTLLPVDYWETPAGGH